MMEIFFFFNRQKSGRAVRQWESGKGRPESLSHVGKKMDEAGILRKTRSKPERKERSWWSRKRRRCWNKGEWETEAHVCGEQGPQKGRCARQKPGSPGREEPSFHWRKAGTLFFKLHSSLPAIWLLRCVWRARVENKMPVSSPDSERSPFVGLWRCGRIESIYSGDQHLWTCLTSKLQENVWPPNLDGSVLDKVANPPLMGQRKNLKKTNFQSKIDCVMYNRADASWMIPVVTIIITTIVFWYWALN